MTAKRLKNENGDDGYVVRAANQILILLPDEPEQIESIMQGPLRKIYYGKLGNAMSIAN